ncbi:bifunctional adenosylcobinamide kinase/adenosylcobinamide-phosphate guanylyltransferase [Pleionea sediminis]|uniref:bifunctional adenosylcobinamide kinase/adenosylcobinamide-phosphate guanylyltransferase n=1 Tax=Pleionea sediminis TaxID=2569479 RepID=UPI001184AD83|nr:bifunctional adenosylcobinamide kinase/adenosylcobinamide-phosphate guanylyltransferase [Pleionea sediminis]
MIHLVIGGARSGKSNYAEKLAQKSSQPITYIATATAGDDEMKKRIAYHQQDRPKEWMLIEEPFYLSDHINLLKNQFVLIDCLTLWLSNWLCTYDVEAFAQEKDSFINALLNSKSSITLVTNEVGSGIVPMGELSRDFVDQAGWLNQAIASVADKVTLVVAGCPLSLKTQKQDQFI